MAYSTYRLLKEKEILLQGIRNEGIVLVYDLETTGLNKVTDRIVQLAVRTCVVGIAGLIEIESRTWYLNPGFPMPDRALQVHGITDAFLEDKPTEDEAFEEIKEYFGDSVVCGYNNHSFDDKMMEAMYQRHNEEFTPKYSLDIYPPVTIVLDASQVANHKLATVSDYYGFTDKIDKFHNAEGDTLATELVFGKLIEFFQDDLTPKNAGSVKVDTVTAVNYWDGKGRVKPRIYVDGFADGARVKFWIDPDTGTYNDANKSHPDIEKYDIEDLEKKVLDIIKCDYQSFRGQKS